MKTLVLLAAPSGSGKSTLAEAIKQYWLDNGRTVAGPYEADNWMKEAGVYKFNPKNLGFCHNSCFNACEEAMLRDVEIVIQSNTNLLKKHRQPYHDLAAKYGYQVQEIFIKADFGNVHGVPAEKVAEMKKSLEF